MLRRLLLILCLSASLLARAESETPIESGHEFEFRSPLTTAGLLLAFPFMPQLNSGLFPWNILPGPVLAIIAVDGLAPDFFPLFANAMAASIVLAVGGAWVDHQVLAKLWRKNIEAKCRRRKDCSVRSLSKSRFRIDYAEGVYFIVSSDPFVVEVQGTHFLAPQLQKYKATLQADIFDEARKVGLFPAGLSEAAGAGHLNFDGKIFRKNPTLLRNFLVDFYNHSELSSGILGNDRMNARNPMGSPERRQSFQEIIADFDRLEFKNYESLVRAYARSMNHRPHCAALNCRGADLERIEIRSVRAQRNFHQFVLLSRLFEARIRYLESLTEPLPFLNQKPITRPYEAVVAFKRFVEESGLDFAEYRALIPPVYRLVKLDSAGEPVRPGPIAGQCQAFLRWASQL